MRDPDTANADIQRSIDREVDLVMSAVDLVASGGATSTMVVGLRLGGAVVEIVRPRAAERAVTVDPLWGPGEETADVVVRRMEPTR